MQIICNILEKIIKKKAGIIPAFVFDETGAFEDCFDSDLSSDIKVGVLDSNSKIVLQTNMRSFNKDKINVIYSRFDIDIDGFIASNRLRRIIITPELMLQFCDETKDKLSGNITLTKEQNEIFIRNFDTIVSMLKNSETITSNVLKNTLSKVFMGKVHTPRDLLIALIKGDFSIDYIKAAYLYDQIVTIINDSFSIDISVIDNNTDLLKKIIVTYLLADNSSDFGPELNDNYLSIKEEELNKLFNFIKSNYRDFEKELASINQLFKGKITNKITYTVPKLFENYIAENIENYENIKIDSELLWTNEMQNVSSFISKINKAESLFKQFVSHTFYNNTISSVIKEYKETLYEIDSIYRELSSIYEDISYNFDFYSKVNKTKAMNRITDMYFNVMSNINSKYIDSFNNMLCDDGKVIRQDELFSKIKFRRKTVFIFADGLRYELAKKLISNIDCEEVIDYDVYSLLPTETEVCMNGYFITDEKIRINNRNTYELIKDNKIITRVIKWRTQKLSEALGCDVISFDDFKETESYGDSVIYFYNDVDIAMHSYDSANKVSRTIDELKEIIDYSLDRSFDVIVLSDHGFIDIEQKIEFQDNDIASEKKKSRYLILSDKEEVNTMFYKDDLKVADFIDMQGKKICFINSINSLRKTSKYTHGGLSLQESIITAILFRTKDNDSINNEQTLIQNLEAYNELKANISMAKDFECTVYAGTKVIYFSIIDSDNFNLRVSIRNYKKGDEFLIVITNGGITDKATISKSGNTIIDKDLDIF